jgi:hypothetical protein
VQGLYNKHQLSELWRKYTETDCVGREVHPPEVSSQRYPKDKCGDSFAGEDLFQSNRYVG